MPTLALLDGHSLAYRAFYALPEDLRTSAGQQTNAAYGFARMLTKLLADEQPDRLAVAWDVGRQTFRTEEYPEYKAQREKSPDTFTSQLPLIDEMLDRMGIVQLRHEGFEADDVIASLAHKAAGAGWDVVIVTGDRDAFQLVDDHVKVLYTRRGISDTVLADAAWVEEKYGIPPSSYLDYAALRGDTSDNLPGIPGVGEKTAAKLITQYGDLDGIFDHVEDQTPKLAENLAAHRDQAYLNRKLMTMVMDLDVPDPDALAWTAWDQPALRAHLEALEFHTLVPDLWATHPDGERTGEAIDVDTVTATGPDAVAAAVAASPLVVHPVLFDDDLAGIVVIDPDGRPVFVPDEALDAARPVLEDPDHPKVGHHLKPLVRLLLDRGIVMAGIAFDSALAAYLVNPAGRSFDLETLAERLLGIDLTPAEEGSGGDQGMLDLDGTGSGPDLTAAGAAAVTVARLVERLEPEVDETGGREVLATIELPLIGILAGMEQEGIGVDRAYLVDLGDDLRARLADLEQRIHEAADGPFNVNSTLQLRELLFDRLGLPVVKKTPKGVPSTDASVLEKLASEHPVVQLILDYREYEKLRSTYVDGYLPLIAPDGRIHTTFNQMGSATGRLSSDHPNLQNIPVRSELGRTIRQAFVARPGWVFVVADYSQIELRILAHMSGDAGLTEAFRQGMDIHTATAASVFGVAPDEVTGEQRRRAKAINFGLLYGMEAFGLAQRLEISRDEASEHIETYFTQFPSVRAFMDGLVDEAKRVGYTETMFGRRRYLPELRSDNFRVRQMGERMALNAPIQGGAADIIKLAMIALDTELADREAVQLLQIHDELVVEAPADEAEATMELVRSTMEGVVELDVPLAVDAATGGHLAETKD